MEPKMTPEDIRTIRTKLGLTQAQTAKLLGYGAVARISEIENGTREPSVSVLRLLAAYETGYRPDDWPDQSGFAEPGVNSCIKCDVELDVKGPTDRVATDRTTLALRTIADRIESDRYVEGHHDVKNQLGEVIGTVYFDFFEEHGLP